IRRLRTWPNADKCCPDGESLSKAQRLLVGGTRRTRRPRSLSKELNDSGSDNEQRQRTAKRGNKEIAFLIPARSSFFGLCSTKSLWWRLARTKSRGFVYVLRSSSLD